MVGFYVKVSEHIVSEPVAGEFYGEQFFFYLRVAFLGIRYSSRGETDNSVVLKAGCPQPRLRGIAGKCYWLFWSRSR